MNDDTPTGRAKGGAARASALSPERRREIAKAAAASRWQVANLPTATHGSPEQPLRIGGAEIDCYVLEGDMRVVTQRSMIRAIGLTRGGVRSDLEAEKGAGAELPRFAAQNWIKPFLGNDLELALRSPIVFKLPVTGAVAYGYPATILADVCDAILRARDAGKAGPRQADIVKQADILVRGFARVGIVALVDEATGYQRDRAKDALAKILEAFVAKELAAWVQTFPADYYEQMFRLRGLEFPKATVQRPPYFGTLTNDIVYKRLAPGVLAELKRVTPRNDHGRPKAKYFQSLTSNVGYPKLKEHLGAVVALMRISKTWDGFMALLNQHYPRYGDTMMLPLDYDPGEDSGRGL
ncbi:P63C domain-containing protein [Brevundimonas sp.]|uniref:P63C domain-containing protein n=1 Tax=Brevundimonas sp. TaxID=1871086 RepID=UPI002D51445A|nr:P63C domain-containing protein [Brevundimonas sp.]HYD28150.1 P63C domain-containing protein [Brevundimonas sp.]